MKTVENLLLEKGLKVWTKGENKRIYINDLIVVGIEKVSNNPKGYRKVSLVYDITKDSFSWSGSTNSMDATIEELIALIRSEVAEANKEEVVVEKIEVAEVNESLKPVATIINEDGGTVTLNVFSNDENGLFDVIGTIPDSDPDEPDEWEIIAERFDSSWEAEEVIKAMYDNGNWGIEYL